MYFFGFNMFINLCREKEASKDSEDRKKELDEIDELKSAIFSDPKLSDPAQEFQRRLQERERQFLPGSERPSQTTRPVRPGKVVTSGSNTASSPITLDPDSPDQSPDIQDVTDAPPSGNISPIISPITTK